jgi:hypothetical protein
MKERFSGLVPEQHDCGEDTCCQVDECCRHAGECTCGEKSPDFDGLYEAIDNDV